jgi:hypothetical protein
VATRHESNLLLGVVVVVAGLAGCSGGDSRDVQSERSPATSADGGTASAPASSTPGPTPAEAEPVRDAFVYAAVIEELVDESTSGRPDPPFKVIFVLDGAVPKAAKATFARDPRTPFRHDVKDGVLFLATLNELPPIEFVARRDSAVVGSDSGKRPGEARDGGAVVTLGPVKGGEGRVEVGSSLWINGLSARWQTYVVAEKEGVWEVTGTTGPLAIS